MRSTIDFCIPFVARGMSYLEYLVDNIEKTADDFSRIRIHVSYHDQAALAALEGCKAWSRIRRTAHARACGATEAYIPNSASHAAAINALARGCSGDIAVFSDYDMAFVAYGWDSLLERMLFDRGLQLCGVNYAPIAVRLDMPRLSDAAPWLRHTYVVKYQNLPNLSFLCVRGETLRDTFGGRMTAFDDFLLGGGLPLRIINTGALARANNIPVGSVQLLDTGYEIPDAIVEKNLAYDIFPMVPLEKQDVLTDLPGLESLSPIKRPEVFLSRTDHSPWLCHFKKGTEKSAPAGADSFTFEAFTLAIDAYLARRSPA